MDVNLVDSAIAPKRRGSRTKIDELQDPGDAPPRARDPTARDSPKRRDSRSKIERFSEAAQPAAPQEPANGD